MLLVCKIEVKGVSDLLLGRNSTSEFDDVGHSDEAQNMMKEYYIGDLVSVCSLCNAFVLTLCLCRAHPLQATQAQPKLPTTQPTHLPNPTHLLPA